MITRKHIIEFIKKQKVAFIASVDEEGFPNIKAMLVPKIQRQVFIFIARDASNMRALC